jgi:Ca-activated chloride channel family protein
VKFAAPGWLIAGALACMAMLWLWRRYDRRQQAALARFVAEHLRGELTQSISVARRRLQRGLYLLALALLFAALARPQWGFRWEEITRRGNDIVFAIDTSRSMTTPDVKPNRLARAKLAIDDFVNQLDGDAVGIVAFAGTAFLACPITLDYGAFHETLSAIDTNTVPKGGTNIASAIREAQAALHRRPGSDKILILVTDGEDLEGGALAAAQTAKQQDGLRIFTVGVGTANGDLIPIPPEQGGGFVKDEQGEFVKSRLDEAGLTALAAATGGIYVPLGTQGEGLDYIYKTVLGPLAKHDLASRRQRLYIDRFQWPLAASLGLLLLSLTVGSRRTRRAGARQPKAAARGAAGAPSAATAIVFALLTVPHGVARADTLSAARAYKKGDYAAAERAFADAAKTDPGTPALHYDLGTAQYREGKFPEAVAAFEQSIAKSPSSDPKRLADQEDAYYDLGNALYRAGQATLQSSQQETLQKWNDAVKAYDTALQLRADDADAKYNRDLVKRKIDALQQNSPQNQGQNQSGQGNSNSPQQNSSGGQPPNSPQNNANNDQKPGQQPPQNQGQPPPQSAGQQSPQNNGQPPPQNGGQQPPPTAGQQQPQKGDQPSPPRKGQASGNPEDQADEANGEAEEQPRPGQMSREEARELLDSVKGDEHRMPMAPMNSRDLRDQSPPAKDW